MSAVYIVFARFKRLSLDRQERYVYPLAERIIKITQQQKARIAGLISRRKHKKSKAEPSPLLKMCLFLASAFLINVGMGVLQFLYVGQKVFINVLVGWKGMNLGSLDQMFSKFTHLVELLTVTLHIPSYILRTLLYPFYLLYRFTDLLNVDFIYNLLTVTCEGAKSPIELFIISLALGVAILFVESHYGLLWSVTLQDMNQSKFVCHWIEGKKLFSFNFISSLVALLLTSVNPFVTIRRFFLTYFTIGAFFANDHVSHNISVACLNIAGFESQELLLVIATSVLVWLLIAPMLYITAEVVCPKGGYTASKFKILSSFPRRGFISKKVLDNNKNETSETVLPKTKSLKDLEVLVRDNALPGNGDIDMSSISSNDTAVRFTRNRNGDSEYIDDRMFAIHANNNVGSSSNSHIYFNSVDWSTSPYFSNNGSPERNIENGNLVYGGSLMKFQPVQSYESIAFDSLKDSYIERRSARSSDFDRVQFSSESDNESHSSVYDSVQSSRLEDSIHNLISSEAGNVDRSSSNDSIGNSLSNDSSIYSFNSEISFELPEISNRLAIRGVRRYFWTYLSLFLSVDLSLVYSIIAWVTYCEKNSHCEQLLQLRSNQRWNQQAFEESIRKFRSERFINTNFWTRYMKFFDNLEKSSVDTNNRIEKKWQEVVYQSDSVSLPPYYSLCRMEQQEMQLQINRMDIPSLLRSFLLSFSYIAIIASIGHLVTAVGRKNWMVVMKKYFLFSCICVGFWTDETYEAYELDSLPKLFAECDANEVTILFVPLIISFRAILLQALGVSLTLVSIAIISLSSAPLFVFSPKMQARIPPLIYWGSRKVAVEREEKETSSAGQEGHVEEWAIKLRSLSIFLTESRILVFFANVVPLYLTLSILEGFDITTGYQYLMVLALAPYFIGSTILPIIYIGKRLNLSDKDFRALWLGWLVRRQPRNLSSHFYKTVTVIWWYLIYVSEFLMGWLLWARHRLQLFLHLTHSRISNSTTYLVNAVLFARRNFQKFWSLCFAKFARKKQERSSSRVQPIISEQGGDDLFRVVVESISDDDNSSVYNSVASSNSGDDSSVYNSAAPSESDIDSVAAEDEEKDSDSYFVSTESEDEPGGNSIDVANNPSSDADKKNDTQKRNESDSDSGLVEVSSESDGDQDGGIKNIGIGSSIMVRVFESGGSNEDEDILNNASCIDADSITVYVSSESEEDIVAQYDDSLVDLDGVTVSSESADGP